MKFSPEDDWTQEESNLFHEAFPGVGKKFRELSRLFEGKTTADVVFFYYYDKRDKKELSRQKKDKKRKMERRLRRRRSERIFLEFIVLFF